MYNCNPGIPLLNDFLFNHLGGVVFYNSRKPKLSATSKKVVSYIVSLAMPGKPMKLCVQTCTVAKKLCASWQLVTLVK